MTRGTMWGMIISASAALGMAVLTKRRRGATRLREAVVRDDHLDPLRDPERRETAADDASLVERRDDDGEVHQRAPSRWSLARNVNTKELLSHPLIVNREDLPKEPGAGE